MRDCDNRLVGFTGLACAALILAGAGAILGGREAAAALALDLQAAGLLPVPPVAAAARGMPGVASAAPVALLPAPEHVEATIAPPADEPWEFPSGTPPVPSAAERAGRVSLAEALGSRLGWIAGGRQAALLDAWLGRLRADGRTALADPGAFEIAARERRRELVDHFGRPAAEAIAARVPLHAVDAVSGELLRVDLDGRRVEQEAVTEPR